MKLILTTVLLFLCLAFIPSCIKEIKVTLDPQPIISESDMGAGKHVYLKVSDERLEKDFGRTNYYTGKEVKNKQNVAEIMYQSISEGLKKKGFNIEKVALPTIINFRVEIRVLQYTVGYTKARSASYGNVKTQSAIKSICENPASNYQNFYQVSSKEMKLNTVVSNVLEKMFRDQELLNCLAN